MHIQLTIPKAHYSFYKMNKHILVGACGTYQRTGMIHLLCLMRLSPSAVLCR